MKSILITLKKEFRSVFRDRKTFITLLLFPLLIPCLIFLYAYMYDNTTDDVRYLIGINYIPNEIEKELLNSFNLDINIYDNKNDLIEAYNNNNILGYIDYKEDINKYYIYTNEDSEDGIRISNYISLYFDNYQEYLTKNYLISENIDLNKAYNNFSYEVVDLDGENWILEMMFTISFTYIIMSIVTSSSNMAISATAVERENGTYETLLTFPININNLIIGKYLSACLMGILSGIIGLILTIGSLWIATNNFIAFSEINFHISIYNVIISILIVISSSFFISGLAILLTSRSKSYKEAQSISSFLNILTIIPMMISLLDIDVSSYLYLIPIFNYQQILMDIFSKIIDLRYVFIVIISSFIYVALIFTLILCNYKPEKVLF